MIKDPSLEFAKYILECERTLKALRSCDQTIVIRETIQWLQESMICRFRSTELCQNYRQRCSEALRACDKIEEEQYDRMNPDGQWQQEYWEMQWRLASNDPLIGISKVDMG